MEKSYFFVVGQSQTMQNVDNFPQTAIILLEYIEKSGFCGRWFHEAAPFLGLGDCLLHGDGDHYRT
jgi:hypothetical protein